MQFPLRHQLGHRMTGLVTRIDLDERLRPETAAVVGCGDLLAQVVGTDRRERSREGGVLANQRLTEIENVHWPGT